MRVEVEKTTPMKRRLSLLATQCWQNIKKQELETEATFPAMPKLDNDASSSPRSSIFAPMDATANPPAENKAPCPISQLDDSLFEPIALVTPPKKRVKTESAAIANADGTVPNSAFDYHADSLSRMTSLQYHQNNYNNYQLYGQSYPFSTAAMYQPQGSMFGQSTNGFLSQYGMSNTSRPQHGFTVSTGSSFETTTSPSNANAPVASATAVTPVTTNRRPSITVGDTNVLLDDFEPLFPDPSENDTKDKCPDLCASSASLGSSTSSLLHEGNIIISTSDSFKENNYAKAEIEVMTGFHTSDLSLQSVIGQLNKHNKNGKVKSVASSKSKSSKSRRPSSSESNNQESQSRFKPFHEEKWNFHFNELVQFKKENGHCLVPHTFPAKPHLARWVKRQRRQYKLRLEGNKNSTMTPDRIKILNEIGFVWDSHEVIWNERFSQLVAYKQKAGHCRVPSYCKDCPQLASWVKCQRRQYKLFWEEGKGSSMTMDRIKLLNSIGFIWEVHPGRKKKENDPHYQHLANILLDE